MQSDPIAVVCLVELLGFAGHLFNSKQKSIRRCIVGSAILKAMTFEGHCVRPVFYLTMQFSNIWLDN